MIRPFCVNCVKAHGKPKIVVDGSNIYIKPLKYLMCHAGGNVMLKVKPDFSCSGFKATMEDHDKSHDIVSQQEQDPWTVDVST